MYSKSVSSRGIRMLLESLIVYCRSHQSHVLEFGVHEYLGVTL